MKAKGEIVEKMISTVGYWEASEWGASVTDYDIVEMTKEHTPLYDMTNKVVRYFAIEHGEEFYFDIPLSEVYQKYLQYK